MRALVVEDETKTASYLANGLTENRFVVDVAARGEEGLCMATTLDYDVIILDVGLPERDGWSIVREIRDQGKDTPILFLTARDTVQDRVKGLELGADDYLVKPFAFSELLARIKTVLRRGPVRREDVVRVAGLEIDLARMSASREGQTLDLTAREFSLLSLLGRRAGHVLSRMTIEEQVWGIDFESDTNVVDVAIRRLRRKVDSSFSKPLIHTVRGIGYVLEER